MNIVDHIEAHAAADRDRPALIYEERRWTYGQLVERVHPLAERLKQGLGLSEHLGARRVGLACPDGIGYVLWSLGLLRAGACVVPIAGELAGPERERLVEALGLHGLVIAAGFDWPEAPGQSREIGGDDSALFGLSASIHTNLHQRDGPRLTFAEDDLGSLQPAFIRFSSGTTGRSKGVVISHESLCARIHAANRTLSIGAEDRVIWILPMAHHFAVSMMLYLVSGATTVIVGSHLASDVLRAGREHRGSVLYASPFHHGMLAAESSGESWPDLRLAVSSAFALSQTTARAFYRRFGQPLCQALGVIEAGLPCINVRSALDKPTSIGRPTPQFEIEVRDESGRVQPAGEVGQLHLRGPGLFDAYLLPWHRREEVLNDGWFATGDLVEADGDGDLYLVGRTHSVINVGGLKCFPEEVEQLLCQHEAVKAARVRGRDHPRFGAIPVAEVVAADPDARPSAAQLTKHCRANLAAYKCPLQFEFVAELPRTPSGKIKRDTSRDTSMAETQHRRRRGEAAIERG